MIKTIRMKNCATYQQEGGAIENCQKINFFYGANGSGKSTISNFLLEQTEPQYGQCEIEWYNNSTTDILVYNKEFRKRNFKENIAGVFTLWRARIEEIEELEQLKKERVNKNEEYFKRKNTFCG